jgi:hypothetical protein
MSTHEHMTSYFSFAWHLDELLRKRRSTPYTGALDSLRPVHRLTVARERLDGDQPRRQGAFCVISRGAAGYRVELDSGTGIKGFCAAVPRLHVGRMHGACTMQRAGSH